MEFYVLDIWMINNKEIFLVFLIFYGYDLVLLWLEICEVVLGVV